MSSRKSIQTTIPDCNGFSISEKSIRELQHCLSRRDFTAEQLVRSYLQYIEEINPFTKSVIEINPDAIKIAASLDEERDDGHVRSILHGIPCLIKDNIATEDDTDTAAGSSMLVGARVAEEAPVVAALRDAGAVILGKANCSEWACMRASYYSEGYSSRGGQTRNPYNLSENPGGSSGGSATAVAANLCSFSLGTETDNSIIFPADRNAVVGIKPTVGLTSRRGVIPLSTSLDSVGPFGRSVEDVAIVLEAICGVDEQDEASAKRPQQVNCNFSSSVETADALKGARFGIPRRLVWDLAREQTKLQAEYRKLEQILNLIHRYGAQLVDVDIPSADEIINPLGWDWRFGPTIEHPHRSEATVCNFEFVELTAKYLAGLRTNPNEIHSVSDIMAYNVKHNATEGGIPGSHEAWPTGQDALEEALNDVKRFTREEYLDAVSWMQRTSREEGIDAALATPEGPLDALIVPINSGLGVAVSVAAKAGYPIISIPAGVNDDGVPFSLGLIQTAWEDHKLIKWASAIEDLLIREGRPGKTLPEFRNLHATNYILSGWSPSS